MPRTIAKAVSLSMGPFLSTTIDLLPLANTEDAKETKTSMVCPDCPDDDAAKMEQFYVGSCGHTPKDAKGFKTGGCAKGVAVGSKWKKVDEDALEEALTSDIQKNQMEVLIRPAAEVDSQTWPSGTSYWAEAPKGSEKFVAVFADLAASPDYALIGLLVLRGTERLYRLRPLNGGIVLQQILRPQEMHQYTADLPPLDEQVRKTLPLIVEGQVAPFDPEAFRSEAVARVKAMLAEVSEDGTGATITTLPTAPKQDSGDVMAALEAMLAANQARKSA